jgi:hypothetical protein
MSAPIKRTLATLVAAMLMAAFSTFLAITVARLVRQHHTHSDGDSPESSDPPASAADGLAPPRASAADGPLTAATRPA